ncbi:MAG: hypothetical protein ACFFC3_17315 [Candidatus Odinarchaeota archaeon]
MSQIPRNIEKINNYPIRNGKTLEKIIRRLNQILGGKREIMYSDIINLIVREGYIGEEYKQLIIWCNYKIRLGKFYLEYG